MRLLAATCAVVLSCLSIMRVGHAQTTTGAPDAGVAQAPSSEPPHENAAEIAPVGEPSAAPADSAPAPAADAASAQDVAPQTPPAAVETGAEAAPAAIYPPTAYEPSPGPSAGSTGVNRRYAYGVPAHSWVRRPGPGAREHEGLFARLTLGVGASQASYRESVDGRSVQDIDTRAIAVLFDASLGGRLVRNLILHAHLSASSSVATQKDVDAARYAAERIDENTALFGLGLTYYFMPYNAYLTGSFGLAGFSETRDDRESIESSTGFGGVLLLGKEWWAGPRGEWGLGVALRLSYMAAPIDIAGVDSTLLANDIGIVFSATYN